MRSTHFEESDQGQLSCRVKDDKVSAQLPLKVDKSSSKPAAKRSSKSL
jgi:hypothetical protein